MFEYLEILEKTNWKERRFDVWLDFVNPFGNPDDSKYSFAVQSNEWRQLDFVVFTATEK